MLPTVHRLPDEVLGVIFTYAHEGIFPLSEPCRAPGFASVCTSWRIVALWTPSIWAFLRVQFGSEQNLPHPATNLAALRTHLVRSRSHPLTVHFIFVRDIDGSADATVEPEEMTDEIVRHSSRWMDFALGGYTTMMHFGVIKKLETITTLPLLDTIIIRTPCTSYDTAVATVLRRSLQLRKLVTSILPSFANVRLDKVIDLKIWVWLTTNGFGTFQSFPSVQSLRYVLNHSESPVNHLLWYEWKRSHSANPPQRLLRVKDLSIRLSGDIVGSGYDLFPYLMPSLDLPSLLELAIVNPSEPDLFDSKPFNGAFPTEQMIAFFHRSQCRLCILDMLNVLISDDDMIAILKHLPTLVELRIAEMRSTTSSVPSLIPLVSSKFLQHLHSDSVPSLVPKLRELRLSVRRETFDEHLFVGMVLSRCLADKPLGIQRLLSVEVIIDGRIDRTAWDKLGIRGLEVWLHEDDE